MEYTRNMSSRTSQIVLRLAKSLGAAVLMGAGVKAGGDLYTQLRRRIRRDDPTPPTDPLDPWAEDEDAGEGDGAREATLRARKEAIEAELERLRKKREAKRRKQKGKKR
ncbi:MAG: hypothetical protein D6729_10600 [Deltaproteobacteria bacterium]|nr:MAG: hypothetical protein D6729_10600 [Deltaproteobacteria bacterium]